MATAPSSQVTTQGAGLGYGATLSPVARLGDGNFANRPASTSGGLVSGLATFSGFLEVTTAGTYTFRSAL
jgi:hypothetical protein